MKTPKTLADAEALIEARITEAETEDRKKAERLRAKRDLLVEAVKERTGGSRERELPVIAQEINLTAKEVDRAISLISKPAVLRLEFGADIKSQLASFTEVSIDVQYPNKALVAIIEAFIDVRYSNKGLKVSLDNNTISIEGPSIYLDNFARDFADRVFEQDEALFSAIVNRLGWDRN